MQTKEMAYVVESILFVAGEPVLLEDMARALDVQSSELNQALDFLANEYDYNRRGLSLKRFGKHVQLATRAEYAPFVEKLLQPVQKQSLSQAAMETLAIVAYKQPVTKAEIEAVRGVKCDYSVQSLSNKGLIVEVGRKDMPGRPILYGTTDGFLSHFGIGSLDELPPLEALQEKEPEKNIEDLVP